MATTKKQSKSKSKITNSSTKSTRGSNRIQMKAAEDSFAQASYQKAKSFIDQNTNLPTAGLALAGAGLLALVSTQKGRGLIKAGAEAILSLVNLPAMTEAVTAKTDFVPASKRASGKQVPKSVKAQI